MHKYLLVMSVRDLDADVATELPVRVGPVRLERSEILQVAIPSSRGPIWNPSPVPWYMAVQVQVGMYWYEPVRTVTLVDTT
jgi:hypothetical protein